MPLTIFVAYLVFHISLPISKKIRSKQEMNLNARITDLKVSNAGEREVTIEIQRLGPMLLYLPDVPWSTTDNCVKGAKFRGSVLVYPSAISNISGRAWPRGAYVCSGGSPARGKDKYPKAGDSLGILLAATTGMRDLLSPESRQLFRKLGVSHLLVISGFHIGIVLSAVFYCVRNLLCFNRVLLQRCSINKIALLLSYLVSLSYVLVIEAGVPALRALLAAGILILIRVTERKVYPLRCLFFIAIVVALLRPTAVITPSYLFSFSAVAGLIICSRYIQLLKVYGKLPNNPVIRWLCFSFVMSCFAWSFSVPISLYFFKSLCPISPLVNVIVSPIFSLLVIIVGGLNLLLYGLAPEYFLPLFKAYLTQMEYFLVWLWQLQEYLPFQEIKLNKETSYVLMSCFVGLNFLLLCVSLKIGCSNPVLSLRGN